MDKQQQIRESLPGDKIELYQIMKAAYDNSFVINDRTGQKMLAENAVPALTAIAACDYFEPKLAAKDTTIKELQAKNEKLTGLLKRTMMLHAGIADLKAGYSADASILEEQWENFKGQHGI